MNPETFAICKSDLFMKSEHGRDAKRVIFGSTLSNDRHGGDGFGKVQLIDATSFWTLLRKSLDAKRREVPFERKQDILRLLAGFDDGATSVVDRDGEERDAVVSRVYPTTHFGFRKITVERPQVEKEIVAMLQEMTD